MREIRQSGSEGGGACRGSSYPYQCCIARDERGGAREQYCAVLASSALRPCRRRRLEGHLAPQLRMCECQLPCVQTERSVLDAGRLHIAKLLIGPVERVADDGPAEVPEVDADLIGSTCSWRRQQ